MPSDSFAIATEAGSGSGGFLDDDGSGSGMIDDCDCDPDGSGTIAKCDCGPSGLSDETVIIIAVSAGGGGAILLIGAVLIFWTWTLRKKRARRTVISAPSVPQEVKQLFTTFDVNRSGLLDYVELRNALQYLGVNLHTEQSRVLLLNYDDWYAARVSSPCLSLALPLH